MDPVAAAIALVLAASACYRTITGKREALTAGLWTAALALGVGALLATLDAALNNITGLDNLSQQISYPAMVISSYLIARMTYDVAGIDSRWPTFYTAISIAGMIALYSVTELHRTQTLTIETVPGAASAWYAIALAIGVFPTHISAIIGVLKMTHKNNLMVWLLAIYGGVGALYPVLIVADHFGAKAPGWPVSVIYQLVNVILLISFGALSLAGVISVYRAEHAHLQLGATTA
jgi:hypothetical protein